MALQRPEAKLLEADAAAKVARAREDPGLDVSKREHVVRRKDCAQRAVHAGHETLQPVQCISNLLWQPIAKRALLSILERCKVEVIASLQQSLPPRIEKSDRFGIGLIRPSTLRTWLAAWWRPLAVGGSRRWCGSSCEVWWWANSCEVWRRGSLRSGMLLPLTHRALLTSRVKIALVEHLRKHDFPGLRNSHFLRFVPHPPRRERRRLLRTNKWCAIGTRLRTITFRASSSINNEPPDHMLRNALEHEGLIDAGAEMPWASRSACSHLCARLIPSSATCGIICLFFAAYGMRIWVPALWDANLPYVPMLSPVYRQAEHWTRERTRMLAIYVHVTSGALMLAAIVLQMDAPTRRSKPWLHRCVGRLYCAFGGAALLSLRWLRSSAGACSGGRGDPLLLTFTDASSAAWLCSTAVGIDAIVRRKDVDLHSRAMLLSAFISAVPIMQRLLNSLLLAPLAMVRMR